MKRLKIASFVVDVKILRLATWDTTYPNVILNLKLYVYDNKRFGDAPPKDLLATKANINDKSCARKLHATRDLRTVALKPHLSSA